MENSLIRRIRKHVFNQDFIADNRTLSKLKSQLMNAECYGLNSSQRNQEIIVSLTSFPARYNTLDLVIKSILLQSYKPDRIILYYDEGHEAGIFPKQLKALEKFGVEFEQRSEHIKSHKKYYYAMKENPDAIIITIDDDVVYPNNLIEELYNTYKRFPSCVCATRVHTITFNNNGMDEYNKWKWMESKPYMPSMKYLATGVGGVLYAPNLLDERFLDLELIKTLSLNADDLWLKVMEVLHGTKVVSCKRSVANNRFLLPSGREDSLHATNIRENMNDVYMRKLIEHFGINIEDFMDQ